MAQLNPKLLSTYIDSLGYMILMLFLFLILKLALNFVFQFIKGWLLDRFCIPIVDCAIGLRIMWKLDVLLTVGAFDHNVISLELCNVAYFETKWNMFCCQSPCYEEVKDVLWTNFIAFIFALSSHYIFWGDLNEILNQIEEKSGLLVLLGLTNYDTSWKLYKLLIQLLRTTFLLGIIKRKVGIISNKELIGFQLLHIDFLNVVVCNLQIRALTMLQFF